MVKENLIEFKCDLCKNIVYKSKSLTDAIIQGWIEISIENPMLDRDWKEVHICPCCMKLIKQKITS